MSSIRQPARIEGTDVTSAGALTLREDGLWVSPDAASRSVSFPSGGHAECVDVEGSSFWFRHRNDLLLHALRRFPPRGAILDIGAGNGYVASVLESEGGHQVAALEPVLDGARNAKSRGLSSVICSTLEGARFRSASISAIGMFDVLEHVEEDGAFLEEVARVLEPRGLLYVTVPAHSWLWSFEDRFAGHFRRYTLPRIRGDLRARGFQIELATYFFAPVVLPILLLRTIPSLGGRLGSCSRAQSQHVDDSGIVARALTAALRLERAWIASGRVLPAGTSCLVVGRRK
jgi:SAM-dependent methyltransferase